MKTRILIFLFILLTPLICDSQVRLQQNADGDFRVKKDLEWGDAGITTSTAASEYKIHFKEAVDNPGKKS